MALFGSKAVVTDPYDDALTQQAQALNLFDQAVVGLDESNATLKVVYDTAEDNIRRMEEAIAKQRERQTLANDNINKNLRVKAKIVALTE